MNKKSTTAALIGTALESYDYCLIALFMPVISGLYFPASDALSSLISGFGFLLIGTLTRPLGGFVFGYIGDKYGRRRALKISVFLMAIPTLLVGVLPPYAVIGMAAPILLAIFKSLQALSCGGELSGAGIYLVEHAEKSKKGYRGALVSLANLTGFFCASVVAFIFTMDIMPDWGWRLSFILAGLLGFVGLYLRGNIEESPEFVKSLRGRATTQSIQFLEFIKENPLQVLCAIGVGGLTVVPFTAVAQLMLPVLKVKGVITTSQMMALNGLYMLFCMASLFFVARTSDRIGNERLMKFGALGIVVLAVPMVYAFNNLSIAFIVPFHLAVLGLNEFYFGPSSAFMTKLFPVNQRYRGVSFGFSTGMILFALPTPYICAKLVQITGFDYFPAVWMIFVALIAFCAVHLGQKYLIKENQADASGTKKTKKAEPQAA